MPCRATQDKWVIVKNSDETWPTGGGNGNPLQYSCLENPVNSMEKQKDMTPEDEPHRLVSVQYATGEEQRAITNSSTKNKAVGPSGNDAQLWMCLVIKVKSDAINYNIA